MTTESAAVLALHGEIAPTPVPGNWELARARTVARWCAIEAALNAAPMAEVLARLTSMNGLCRRAEESCREHAELGEVPCRSCPLFQALGGGPADVGCRSILDPILEAVYAGRTETARAKVAAVIRTLEEMPLPEELDRPIRGMRPI